VTTEIMLVVALTAVVVLVMIVFAQDKWIKHYSAALRHSEGRIKDWIGLWKNEKQRADDLQTALRLEQIAHSVEE
jgi:glucan phosphoethanolaminetransferase (alkaline phosphatase superfamily)